MTFLSRRPRPFAGRRFCSDVSTKAPNLSDRLHELKTEQAIARDEAMVDYTPVVCGLHLLPVSLMSLSRLRAFRNAFVMNAPATFEDVANFCWIHDQRFGQFNRSGRRAVYRACWRALHPRFETLNTVAHVFALSRRFRWLRPFLVPPHRVRFQDAVTEIRRLLAEALADYPVAGDKGEPIPYSYEAYILNTFRRELHMSFDEVRAMPVRRMTQHLRELIHHANPKSLSLMTAAEAEIWREHLS